MPRAKSLSAYDIQTALCTSREEIHRQNADRLTYCNAGFSAPIYSDKTLIGKMGQENETPIYFQTKVKESGIIVHSNEFSEIKKQ